MPQHLISRRGRGEGGLRGGWGGAYNAPTYIQRASYVTGAVFSWHTWASNSIYYIEGSTKYPHRVGRHDKGLVGYSLKICLNDSSTRVH